jgi:nucleoside-diphosphate-sugar epimerase
VLVIGEGSEGGFLSKCVVSALNASDWATPVVVQRRAERHRASPVQVDVVDANDAAALRASLQDAWGVVNCVTSSSGAITRGAHALFAAAQEIPNSPRIVYVSSQAIYGEARGDVIESTPRAGTLSAYGAAKAAAEKLAAKAPSVVILRPGIIYGPGCAQWSERIAGWLMRHRIGDLGRSGDGYCNLVYVDDVVHAVISALQGPDLHGQIFNLSLPQPPTWNEYFIRYAKALGAVPVSRITRRRLVVETKLLAPSLKLLQILVQKFSPRAVNFVPEPIPPSAAQVFRQEIRMSVRAAENTLGMCWTDLNQGLAAAATSYLAKTRKF